MSDAFAEMARHFYSSNPTKEEGGEQGREILVGKNAVFVPISQNHFEELLFAQF